MSAGRGVALVLAALALFATGATRAQTPSLGGFGAEDNGKPVNIEAEQGVEWQQAYHVYIARGNVKATRGDSTLFADTLYAYYRPTPGQPPAQAQPASAPAAAGKNGDAGPFADGSTQIFRLVAEGNVRLATPTQTVYGDHGVYDVDQAVVVMTGNALKMVTPRDVVTAKDSLEWYDQKQIGVARGDAIAVRDTKRIRGDVLTAHLDKPDDQASHISRIDASGNVIVTSQDQIARGDTGVYNVDTGIATLSGHVTLTRGQNELRGQYAVVDMNKNVGHLLPSPPSAKLTAGPAPRVEGLLVPPPKSAPGKP